MRTTFYPTAFPQPATRLLLFFNGWAMTPASVEHMTLPEGYDFLAVEDYRDDTFAFDFSPYQEIVLVAWSMGVWAAQRLFHWGRLPKVSQAIAIAGTPMQRSDEYGIPEEVFDATLASLNEENRERFNRRMCGGKRLRHLFEALAQRPTEEIWEELKRVQYEERTAIPNGESMVLWTRAHVPLRDRIVPAAHQMAYWNRSGVPIETHPQEDHYLFQKYTSWSELLL